jgi:hypothetical protein
MTLAKLIAQIQTLRPSQYDEHQLTAWVNEIEAQAVDEVFNRAMFDNTEFKPYDIDLDAEKELLIPDENSDVYLHYLAAKIDYWNGEIDRYNNSAVMYDASWNAFASKYRRNHKPRCTAPRTYGCLWWPDPLRN